MGEENAKIIKIYSSNGTLDGVLRLDMSPGNGVLCYHAARNDIEVLLGLLTQNDDISRWGVYILYSDTKIYIGQSTDLGKRISQHFLGKTWWDKVVILTKSGNSLTHTEIDYFENELIEKALTDSQLECENKRSGNPINLDRTEKTILNQYLKESLFLMKLAGVNVFGRVNNKKTKKNGGLRKQTKGKTIAKKPESENSVAKIETSVPLLPNQSLKIGAFVKTAMENLSSSGYVFSDTDMELLCGPTSMKTIIGLQRNMPFFKLYQENDTDDTRRYYKKPITFGNYTVLLNSQLYEADRQPFIAWYQSL